VDWHLLRTRGGALVIAMAFCVLPAWTSGATKRRTRAVQGTSSHKRKRPVETREKGIRGRYYSLRGRLARARYLVHRRSRYADVSRRPIGHPSPATQISPGRTDQIQEALIQAGDLQGDPTGRWDAETRDAMRKYQQTNGFAPTGLPDAKSLMKMGLGPHPLPADVNPMTRTSGESGSSSPDPGSSRR
jgi:hypothetical protein